MTPASSLPPPLYPDSFSYDALDRGHWLAVRDITTKGVPGLVLPQSPMAATSAAAAAAGAAGGRQSQRPPAGMSYDAIDVSADADDNDPELKMALQLSMGHGAHHQPSAAHSRAIVGPPRSAAVPYPAAATALVRPAVAAAAASGGGGSGGGGEQDEDEQLRQAMAMSMEESPSPPPPAAVMMALPALPAEPADGTPGTIKLQVRGSLPPSPVRACSRSVVGLQTACCPCYMACFAPDTTAKPDCFGVG